MTRSSADNRVRKPRGFTLLELMIAVLISSIVIMGIVAVYRISVHAYRIEDQALQAMAQLRVGMLQLKSDLRNASFNAPAQSNEEGWTFAIGMPTMGSVAIERDGPPYPVAVPADNVNIQPMRVRLAGDYEAHRIYKAARISGAVITLDWAPEDGTQADFERIFAPPHMLRVELFGGGREEYIIPIAGSAYNGGTNPVVSVTSPVPNVLGFKTGSEVSVVSYVRYRIVRDPKVDPSVEKFDLIREKLDPRGQPVDGTWLTIAEYVVDLQFYDFCFNVKEPEEEDGEWIQDPVQIRCFPTLEDLGATGRSLAADDTNEAHLLRSVKFKLSTRTPFEDPQQQFMPKEQVDMPLRAFEVNPDLEGKARVYEGAASVFFTGIQARGR